MFLHLLKDKYIRKIYKLDLIILGLIIIIALAKFLSLEEPIILHYDIFKGVDFLGSRVDLYGILFANIIFVFLDLALADFLYDRERFFSYVLAIGSLILEIIFLIVVITIVLIN